MSEEELKEEVIKAIKEVYDPEIPVNVYELGLIYDVKIFPVNNVYVLMTLTSPSCPSAEAIPVEIERFGMHPRFLGTGRRHFMPAIWPPAVREPSLRRKPALPAAPGFAGRGGPSATPRRRPA